MTLVDTLDTDRVATLEAKIDLLTERVLVLTDEAEQRARQRRMLEELGGDLSRISGDALEVVTRELDSLSATADLADSVRLLRRLVEAAPDIDRAVSALQQASALIDDVAPLGTDVLAAVTDRLADAERKGYFTFARAGGRIADRIVTSFDEDDLEQLGDNVVTILETVREVTQPELLTLLGRMIEAVQAEQRLIEDDHGDAPSFWAIAKELRDPDVRRGMARALHTLKAVSATTSTTGTTTGTTATETTGTDAGTQDTYQGDDT